MGNLTREARLVQCVNSIDPVPDHYLVIFKKVGYGRRFHANLSPGEKLKRSLFESPDSFITFAVSSDTELRHRFTRTYQTHEQIHSFILNLTVEYRIFEPRALVEKVEHDPLQRIEDEIHSAVVQRTKLLSWSDVEQEQIDLEYLLFQASAGTAATTSNLERIKRFAEPQGIEVRRIAVVRKLPKDEIRVPVVKKLEQQKQELMIAHHETTTIEQGQRQILEAQERGFQRGQAIADGIAQNATRAIGQATDGVRSFRDIHNAIHEFAGIQSTLGVPAAGPPRIGDRMPGALPGSAGALPGVIETTSPLSVFLADLCSQLGILACDPAQRSEVLSISLHLLAEVLRGGQRNDETLERYRKALEGKASDLITILGRDQIRLLQRLQDTPQLEAEIC